MAEKILRKGEPKPYRLVRTDLRKSSRTVIICDHASNCVPESLKNLGLARKVLQKHIAWDPGTETIGRYMQKALGTPLVLASYSRLVVDLNRGHDNDECMRDTSDGVKIPGNKGLSKAQGKRRLDEIFWPYHDAVDAEIERFLRKGTIPLLMSIHSFTPVMKGFKRPWHIGVMWNRERAIAKKLVALLRKNNPKLTIGENKPYSLKDAGLGKDSIRRHAGKYKIPHIVLEFRQDLVGTKAGALKFAKILHESAAPVLANLETCRRG
jgi:predicted N-formylglutamate amidohydrolase